MMKHEFEERLGKSVTQDEYDVIERVYAFHPLINDVNGKDQIVAIYKKDGMGRINDMFYRANKIAELEYSVHQGSIALERQKKSFEEEKIALTKRFQEEMTEVSNRAHAALTPIMETIALEEEALAKLKKY